MNIPSPKPILAGAVRAGLVLALAVSARAAVAQAVVVQDSFTLNGSTRVEGGSLSGTTPDVSLLSGATWKVSTAPAAFTSAGAITDKTNTSGVALPAEARIAITEPTASMTVSADIVAGSADWVAVGFAKNASTSSDWFASSVLWVMIRPSGSWTVFANGTSTTVAGGSVLGFSSIATYTLGITYDPATGTASASLTTSGGTTTTLLSDKDVSGYVSGTSIAATGFRIHNRNDGTTVAGSASIDNFLVTTTAAIPEPRTAALWLGALAVGGALVRRRARN